MRYQFLIFSAIACLFASQVLAQNTPADRNRRQQPATPQTVFETPGVDLTEDQRSQIESLRKEFGPRIQELQRKKNSIVTPEQRHARQEALRTAREDGKSGQQARQASDTAANLTDAQKETIAANQKELADRLSKVQSKVYALLTVEQLAQLTQTTNARSVAGRNQVAPTHRDVKYGPYDRNMMDVWLAKSDKPTPVLVSIHGGGFRGGNKSINAEMLRECLDSGISVVAITYRLSGDAIAPAQFMDSARAIQFVRHNAAEWNLDPARFAATGNSAGAGISLWLGFHDDLADPENEDPVLRQSTRLSCMAVYNGQTSYDPRFIRELFPDTTIYQESALAQLYDVDLKRLDALPKEKYDLFEEVSPLHHLTKDDAPASLFYASDFDTPITSQGIGIHHARFGKALQDRMKPLGIDCEVHPGTRRDDNWSAEAMVFIKKHLGIK